jgi:hypothetical protein
VPRRADGHRPLIRAPHRFKPRQADARQFTASAIVGAWPPWLPCIGKAQARTLATPASGRARVSPPNRSGSYDRPTQHRPIARSVPIRKAAARAPSPEGRARPDVHPGRSRLAKSAREPTGRHGSGRLARGPSTTGHCPRPDPLAEHPRDVRQDPSLPDRSTWWSTRLETTRSNVPSPSAPLLTHVPRMNPASTPRGARPRSPLACWLPAPSRAPMTGAQRRHR